MKAEDMWEQYGQSHDLSGQVCEAWAFGSGPDALADLVIQGVKTATSSLYTLYEIEWEALPEEGSYSVILDSRGEARCIVKTTRVNIVPFNEVSAAHAYREGEGDRSLDYWSAVHKAFFAGCLEESGLAFSETADVVCEEFEVVYIG